MPTAGCLRPAACIQYRGRDEIERSSELGKVGGSPNGVSKGYSRRSGERRRNREAIRQKSLGFSGALIRTARAIELELELEGDRR